MERKEVRFLFYPRRNLKTNEIPNLMAKKMDKEALLEAINKCADLTREQKADLCELVGEQRKYGLVWEDTPENVYEELRTEIPIMREDKSKAIINSDTAPNHIIIEGDNYKALTNLCYTHAGAIDVIYIDPPYNTGKKDFSYNDSFVDKNNGFRHSKWLSFMEKRLKLAKELLADTGVIFISIDDNEQSQLKMLCDEVFGEGNFVATLPTIMNLKGNQDQFGFAGTHEYTLVYARKHSSCYISQFTIGDDDTKELKSWQQDEIGLYKKGATLKSTGVNAPKEKRPYLFYPILIEKSTLSVTSIGAEEFNQIYNPSTKSFDFDFLSKLRHKYESLGYYFVLPMTKGLGMSWRWQRTTVIQNNNDVIVELKGGNVSLYKKQRPKLGDLPTKKPKSIFYKPIYSSGNGTAQLKQLGLESKFRNPKPFDLIYDFLYITTHEHSTVLDFFAGSGTTLHAVMALNKEDGGDRKCILVNTNEGKICDDVTYVRNKKVIEGYTTLKGERVEGLKENNLRYFRMEKEQRQPLQRNREALAAAMVDMLRMKHNVYTQRDRVGALPTNPPTTRYYEDRGHGLLILMDSVRIGAMVKAIKEMSFGENAMQKIEVYVYSDGAYAYDDDFLPVKDRVNLHALPAPFLEVFRRVAPKP